MGSIAHFGELSYYSFIVFFFFNECYKSNHVCKLNHILLILFLTKQKWLFIVWFILHIWYTWRNIIIMCLLVCICYMSVGVYLIKMNIYSFACEIIVYIHRESQRDQHAVYVCCTSFAINFLDVDIHIYMTVWSIKLQCRIFFKIYGKLYVEHYFMCISIFFYRN